MHLKQRLLTLLLGFGACYVHGQSISAPVPQPGLVSGCVMDADGAVIPGAVVDAESSVAAPRRGTTAAADGSFVLNDLPSAIPLHIHVQAAGFDVWVSPDVTLSPGQRYALPPVVLQIASVNTDVTAVFADQLAIQQVHQEEKQRAFGILPNFFASYDPVFVPLSPKLKFSLAFRTATDAATIGVSVVLAGIDQAGDTPAYTQGMKGYGQRLGSVYAFNSSQVMIGGALLPTVFRQDPRYFYQGTGTTKSRLIHALTTPVIARGDNGHRQFNISSLGGDVSAASLATVYRPPASRGVSKIVTDVLTLTGAHIVHAMGDEFLFHGKN